MGRIETSGKLMEYLDEFDILFPLTRAEAEQVVGYTTKSGYTLETDGHGQLYKVDMESGDSLETDIDQVIDAACEQNYKMISDTRDYFKLGRHSEWEVLSKTLEGLKADEKILNAAFQRTYFQKELRGKIQEILPPVDITAGRRLVR